MALTDISVDLIESCRQGDRESVEELIRLITPELYRILFSVLRDHDDTDEVLQETLVRVFRYIGNLKDVERFPAWAMRIGMNQVQTFRARRGRSRLYPVEDTSEISNSAIVLNGTTPQDPRERMMNDEIRGEILEAMETLPTRQKMATVLFELEGMSIKEIAESLECSEGAVKFNIHEGRKKLKAQLAHLVEGRRWRRTAGKASARGSAAGSSVGSAADSEASASEDSQVSSGS